MFRSPEDLWKVLWEGSQQSEALINIFWLNILKAYSSKGRYYHNIQHIVQILNASFQYSNHITDLKTLQLAVFYHDIVYSSKSKENEELSAKMAEQNLNRLNYPKTLIEKCSQYILATKNHTNSLNDKDLDYLLDFDLEILGFPWIQYLEYTRLIRKEYHFYPDIIYKPGRKKVLEYFLNKPRIYKTSEYHTKFELLARENLKKELELLK